MAKAGAMETVSGLMASASQVISCLFLLFLFLVGHWLVGDKLPGNIWFVWSKMSYSGVFHIHFILIKTLSFSLQYD